MSTVEQLVVVEDDPIFAGMYAAALRQEGYRVETAADGLDGLELIRRLQPDAVLLDLGLPGMHGVEVLRRLREHPDTTRIPVMVMTASYQNKPLEEAHAAGASLCVRKSDCTPKAVVEAMGRILAQGRAVTSPSPHGKGKPGSVIPSVQEFRAGFFGEARLGLSRVRESLRAALSPADHSLRGQRLLPVRQEIGAIATGAAICGFREIAQLASTLEALIEEMTGRRDAITASTSRTLEQAVAFLGDFVGHWITIPDDAFVMPPRILVVDDDAISLETVRVALERAGLNSLGLATPGLALEVCRQNSFDLFLFDVDLPEMSGFELCERLRLETDQGSAPVVFVTGHSGFEQRARSLALGAADFIAKPFPLAELAVKSLCHLFRGTFRAGTAVEPEIVGVLEGREAPVDHALAVA